MYLLSYHQDLGAVVAGVTVDAHKGDSEYVLLWVGYDEVTMHWYAKWAYYSAHGGSGFAGRASLLEYPDHELGYPRVWVAHGKHGGYRARHTCNAGGFGELDDCTNNVDDERVEVIRERNLGSGEFQFLDCALSESPGTYPGTECYWYVDPQQEWFPFEFCGWNYLPAYRDGCATAYGVILDDWGFWAGIE